MLNDVEKITECCGCKLCKYVCKANAISFIEDEQGFYYPKINYNKCIKCSMCTRNCPSIKYDKNYQAEQIFSYENRKEKKHSASGGAFRTLAKILIKDGYVIYGAAFDEKLIVSHIRVDSELDLNKICNSKYVQSDMENVYKSISKDIENQKKIVFSGTPCQVSAVKNHFKIKDDDKFILIDILCHGVPNQTSFNKCIKLEEDKKEIKILNFNFRKKINGDPHGFSYQYLLNGKRKECKGHYFEFPFYRAYLQYSIFRNSCYACNYSTFERVGDLTIGDFWGIENYTNLDSNKGISLILANTIVGNKLLELLPEKKLINLDLNSYLYNDALYKPTPLPNQKLRNDFFNCLNSGDYRIFEKKVLPKDIRKRRLHSKIPYKLKNIINSIRYKK